MSHHEKQETREIGIPKSPEEWQTAVDAANGALALDSARQYGLVSGGPKVNVERCVRILRLGKIEGFKPSRQAIERFILALIQEEKRKAKQ